MKSLMDNDYGKLTTDQCNKLDVNIVVKRIKNKQKKMVLASKIDINGRSIKLVSSKVHNGGTRFWFKCPICSKRCGIIYENPINTEIGCRTCLNLDYRSHRYKKMIESELHNS